MNSGLERLIQFSFYYGLFLHVAACLMVTLSTLSEEDNWVMSKDVELEGFELYTLAFYFTITTVATVGYGDFSPVTVYERIFCIVLIVLGVSSFSLLSGALSSLITNYD
jgi:hypothetical protein